MKIAYVTDQILPQNATDTAQLVSMASAFGEADAEVELVIPTPWLGRRPERQTIADYYAVQPTFELRAVKSLFPSIRGLEKLAHAIAACRTPWVREADVIYTRNLPVVSCALRFTDRPIIYETYRPWPDQSRAMAARFRYLEKQPRFMGAILHSELAASSYRHLGFHDQRLLVAHNGYDPRLLGPDPGQNAARRKISLDVEGPVVAYAGHISPKKGLGLVLDMAAGLPHVHFLLVGAQGQGSFVRQAAARPNVSVVGWQTLPDLVPYLYAADILLIPPTAGPLQQVGNTVLPIKTFVYMATGRPIFAPNTPDLREVLVDGDNAILVPPDQVEEAISCLRQLIDTPELQSRLGNAARVDASTRTWANRAKEILNFIDARLADFR